MAAVVELLRADDAGIYFGNHELEAKAKKEDYEFCGDIYKVKTFREITKLEKNGKFVYESVPGTSVNGFLETEEGVTFLVEGKESAQITLELEDNAEYQVTIGGVDAGVMKTNMSGKLNLNVEFEDASAVEVSVRK